MKRFIYCLLAVCFCFSLISCEKDGGDDSGYSSKIIGSWTEYKSYEEYDGDSYWWYWEDGDDIDVLIFEPGGEGMDIYYCPHDNDTEYEYFDWKIKGDKITISWPDDDEVIVGTIIKLTDEEMVIESNDEGELYRGYYLRVEED